MVTCIHNGHIRAPSLLMFTYSLKVQVTVSEKVIKNFKSHDIVKYITIYLFSYFFLPNVADISNLDAAEKLFRICICVNLTFYGHYPHLLREWFLSTPFSKYMLAENDPTNCDFASFRPSTFLNIKVINMAFHQ